MYVFVLKNIMKSKTFTLGFSGTFKFQKTDLRRDGFNPSNVSDRLYFLDSSRGRYIQLDEELYQSVLSGKHKL